MESIIAVFFVILGLLFFLGALIQFLGPNKSGFQQGPRLFVPWVVVTFFATVLFALNKSEKKGWEINPLRNTEATSIAELLTDRGGTTFDPSLQEFMDYIKNNNRAGRRKQAFLNFSWPPSKPSAFYAFTTKDLSISGEESFFFLFNRINRSLANQGYKEKNYYWIPQGFAVVTKMEKIDKRANINLSERWSFSRQLKFKEFSLEPYYRRLARAEEGRHRLFVFLLQSNTNKEAVSEIKLTALVYEFEKAKDGTVTLIKKSKHPASAHLQKAGLL